jgi:hypothetical protein
MIDELLRHRGFVSRLKGNENAGFKAAIVANDLALESYLVGA